MPQFLDNRPTPGAIAKSKRAQLRPLGSPFERNTPHVKTRKFVAIGAALGVAIAGISASAPAMADPVSSSYVLVGSDTLDAAVNALANGTAVTGATVRVTANGNPIASFDAFGSPAIQTKPNGPYFGRPSGSGNGVTALRRSIDGAAWTAPSNTTPAKVITGQIDIARSSSGPGNNANAAGQLLYVPFARDAVSYAYKGGGSGIEALTAAQLKEIYECTTTSIGGTPVTPRLPQNGSGTRSFFLSAIGVTTPGACVNATATTLPENDGTAITDGQIIPFSVAQWIAQANGVQGVNTTAGVSLGSALGGTAPTTGTVPNMAANPTYYANTTFGRDTYLVVEYKRVNPSDPAYDAALAGLVDSSSATSLTSFGSLSSSPGAVKKKFGFLAPSTTSTQRAFLNL